MHWFYKMPYCFLICVALSGAISFVVSSQCKYAGILPTCWVTVGLIGNPQNSNMGHRLCCTVLEKRIIHWSTFVASWLGLSSVKSYCLNTVLYACQPKSRASWAYIPRAKQHSLSQESKFAPACKYVLMSLNWFLSQGCCQGSIWQMTSMACSVKMLTVTSSVPDQVQAASCMLCPSSWNMPHIPMPSCGKRRQSACNRKPSPPLCQRKYLWL